MMSLNRRIVVDDFLDELGGEHELGVEQLLFLHSLVHLPFFMRQSQVSAHHHDEERDEEAPPHSHTHSNASPDVGTGVEVSVPD